MGGDVRRRVERFGEKELLFVHGSSLEEDLEYVRAAGLCGVRCHREDVARMVEERLESLVVQGDSSHADIPAIRSMPWLVDLGVGGGVDLRGLERLEQLHVGWHKKLAWPSNLGNLRRLVLANCRLGDLASLPAMALEDLHLIEGRIESLAGPHDWAALTVFKADYARALRDVDSLGEARKLLHVELDHCKSIGSLDVLRHCHEVEHLSMIDCGTIESLAFVREMPKLRHLVFAGTTIGDGDMQPLLGRQLEHLYFNGKRSYSHTLAQVRASS